MNRTAPRTHGHLRHTLLMWGIVASGCSEYDLKTGDDVDGGIPDIAVSPDVLDYGVVDVGEPSAQVVQVTNEGDAALTVDRFQVSDGADRGYSAAAVEPLPWLMAPGASESIVVTLTAVDDEPAFGTLSIGSDDPDEPVLPVQLLDDTDPPCDDGYAAALTWQTSGLWFDEAQPVDAAGADWFDRDFDDSAWVILAGLPDRLDFVQDNDVFYRTMFSLGAVVGTTQVEFEGNDGVWLYVNGTFVGHWGSEWHEPGCINDTTGECGVNEVAPPVDVTPFLRAGINVFAVMLTNGPSDYYLDIRPTCVE